MRFPTIFRRRIGEPRDPNKPGTEDGFWFEHEGNRIWKFIPELGSDALPAPGEQPSRRDNLHSSRLVNVNGFPSQRVVVGYQGPKGAPPLLASLYLLDETSGFWFEVPSPSNGVLTPGCLAYFDPPCLLDHSRAKKNSEDESHQAGSLETLLVVRSKSPDAGEEMTYCSPPPGVYTFVLGTDVSNPG